MANRPQLYLLFSLKHDQWWCPESAGYTGELKSAGLFSEEEAGEITEKSMTGWELGGRPPTIAIEVGEIFKAWGWTTSYLRAVINEQAVKAVPGWTVPDHA